MLSPLRPAAALLIYQGNVMRFGIQHALTVTLLCGIGGTPVMGMSYEAVLLSAPSGSDMTLARAVASGDAAGYSYNRTPGATNHALLWTGGSVIDLTPAGTLPGVVQAMDGTHQVGLTAGTPPGAPPGDYHAAMWTGSAASYVDINPAGYATSAANGVSGNQVVGTGVDNDGIRHAFLLDLASGTAITLDGPSAVETRVYATDGIHQVGEIITQTPTGDLLRHPVVWTGTATSLVDLTPPLARNGFANGVNGDQVVGMVDDQAALWLGTTYAYINLTPGNFGSVATATNGTYQVGHVGQHAAVWAGSAASVVDLQQFLPDGYTSSEAYAIDEDGAIAGWAYGPAGEIGVMWVPTVPEPSIGCLMVIVLSVVGSRKWR